MTRPTEHQIVAAVERAYRNAFEAACEDTEKPEYWTAEDGTVHAFAPGDQEAVAIAWDLSLIHI